MDNMTNMRSCKVVVPVPYNLVQCASIFQVPDNQMFVFQEDVCYRHHAWHPDGYFRYARSNQRRSSVKMKHDNQHDQLVFTGVWLLVWLRQALLLPNL